MGSYCDLRRSELVPEEASTTRHPSRSACRSCSHQERQAGLVVLATGLGKTWLAAFDSANDQFQRVLFVAHRKEILNQAMQTFRLIRPLAKLGRYTGQEKSPDADV